jgi:D-sedoheptulose 7-phosphate isomerase
MATLNLEASMALIRRRLTESIHAQQQMLESDCVEQAAAVAVRIVEALSGGHKVIFFGNGGSSMDGGHLAAELVGRFRHDRPALPAISLADSTAAMTAIANDYEYADVFARQVRGLGVAGDVLVGLTTSGNSPNVVRALDEGRRCGLLTVVLTGSTGGRVAEVAEICIRVPSTDTARIQEASMHLGHTICELVEATLFPA